MVVFVFLLVCQSGPSLARLALLGQVGVSAIRGGTHQAGAPAICGVPLPLGASGQVNEFLDWNMTVPDETKVYQRKHVVTIAWPSLPNNVREKENFLAELKLLGSNIDESTDLVISKWFDCADKQLGDDYQDILEKFQV